MTPLQLRNDANEAIKNNQRMTLIRPRGHPVPAGFPRGKLLCENFDGNNVYSYDPQKILDLIKLNNL